VLIRIEGFDLPGRTIKALPHLPNGHDNIHVAVQGRKGEQDLLALTPGDAPAAHWEIEAQIVARSPLDLRGPQLHGKPGHRFIYLSWGAVDQPDSFTMFRRAKLWLDTVPEDISAGAVERGKLLGRLALTDPKGLPVCASVRPPWITWWS
jgi:hypothetical protein